MEYWWAYVVAGLVCGTFSAVFGVGSGIILVPTLVLIFSLGQKSAQGICLAAMVPMVLVGAIRYKMNPAIDVKLTIVVFLAVGGVVGALIGSWIAGALPASLLRKIFAVVMLVAAMRMLITPGPRRKAQSPDDPAPAAQSQDAQG